MPAPPIRPQPLPYAELLEARPDAAIDTLVLHCTELPDLATAREYGERVRYPSGTGDSGHYYVDRDGSIVEYVPPGRTAHHTRGWNARSIGIELVNTGRWPHWLDSRHQAMAERYPDPQIAALVHLLRHLKAQFPSLTGIAGHEDLDLDKVAASDDPAIMVRRKRDPGPLFPWARVLADIPLHRILAPSPPSP